MSALVTDIQSDKLLERLSFHGLTPDVRQVLNDNRDYALHYLPKAFDALYKHAASHPAVASIITGSVPKNEIMAAQMDHWAVLLTGKFDDSYIASVKRMGEIHHRISLEPSLYIGGYNFLMRSLISIMTIEDLGNDLVATRDTLVTTPILQALISAVMFDMDCVIEAFMSFRDMYLD